MKLLNGIIIHKWKEKTKKQKARLLCILCFIASSFYAAAQPSGGPYGPIRQNYKLPEVSGKIYYVSPDGKADVTGDQPAQPTTIESALEKVKTGDAIILRGGTYRTGDLKFNQGITIQPYADEQPVFKGTYQAKDWKRIGGNVWKVSWDRFFQSGPDDWWNRDSYGKSTPLHLFNNDMVFVDGKILKSVGWEGEVNQNSFYIDYRAKSVYIGVDPTDRLVEITAFNMGLQRVTNECHGKVSDKKGFVLRGITFTQYAHTALQMEGSYPVKLTNPSEFGKDIVGSVIEHCTFSFCGRVGADLRGDNLIFRHCKVHDTTTEGVYLNSSSDCLLEKNMFSRNNIEEINGYYPAAVKIFNQTYRVTCKDNLIYDLPVSNGIWYDVGNVDGRFINNWVTGVGTNNGNPGDPTKMWSNYNGFFFEISKGAICIGNIFEKCDQAILVLNSANVEIYQNTFINSTACISRDTRSAQGDKFGWHPSTGPDVNERFGHVFVNNLLVGTKDFKLPLLKVDQAPKLCGILKDSQVRQMDYNVFVKSPESNYSILAQWAPSENTGCKEFIESLDALKKVFNGSSANSKYFENYSLPLFKSVELGNYELMSEFPGAKTAMSLPANIQKLIGLQAKYAPYIGAYPLK